MKVALKRQNTKEDIEIIYRKAALFYSMEVIGD